MNPGELVLCICDHRSDGDGSYWLACMPNRVQRGCIYTVREIIDLGPQYNLGIRLEELHNPVVTWEEGFSAEGGFPLRWFRPIRKPDISNLVQKELAVI